MDITVADLEMISVFFSFSCLIPCVGAYFSTSLEKLVSIIVSFKKKTSLSSSGLHVNLKAHNC